MPKNDSDDENDSCVLVGTPLIDLFPEDAKFSVKPKRPEEQIVTDEKGRQRFHGAFTGGFSAGYFNTVGSKEGWTPSTFKSSRNEKADKKSFYRPEDFMDQEDFNDHGIAPKNLKIKSDYKDQFNQKDTTLAPKHNTSAFILDDLIKPVQNTIGVRMLRKMGWREGQGIGPRIKRKLRKLKSKLNYEPGRKIYGVALPTESDESENEELEDDYLVSTFDVNDFQFEIKEDLFGLGYKRLDVGNLFGHTESGSSLLQESPAASLLFPMVQNKKSKKCISGQAFGVGEYEDEDDIDVYRQDNMDQYDFELNSSKQNDTKKMLNKSYGFGAFENEIAILSKYLKSNKKLEPSKVFEAPHIPDDFDLIHKFPRKSRFDDNNRLEKDDSMSNYIKSVSVRAELLGEEYQIKPDSVLDLVSNKDREFLKEQKANLEKPIMKDNDTKEMKDKRYESFVSMIKKNYKDPYSFLDTKHLTEWEKEKEKEEFTNKYQEQLKKLESYTKTDSSRFVSKATLNENNQEIETNKIETEKKVEKEPIFIDKEEMTEMHKAAMDKKYGQLTRVEYEWRPNPVLCKRFNVPNPYKDTKEYGTVKNEPDRKKTEKFSFFNIMTAQSRFDKEKTKSLFEEINADLPLKQGPSNVKTLSLSNEKSEEKNKIEFESKNIDEPNLKTDFSKLYNEPIVKEKKEEIETKGLDNKDNVYLQERPNVDLFKAIFEDENEQEEEEEELETIDDDNVKESDNESNREKEIESKTSIVSSSIPNIDFEQVNKYLKKDEEPTFIPEKVKFTQLVKNLAKKTEISSSDSSSDSSSSDLSEVEIVYEEVSVSNEKKKKKSKDSKSKKKKKHHHKKKKSKKSHKKN